MKIKLGVLFVLGFVFSIFSQKHEIGVFGGVPNIIGDVGKTNYIQPFPLEFKRISLSTSMGINYRYNFNPRQSLRLNLLYSEVYFSDRFALEDYRYERRVNGFPLEGTNSIIETALMYEYYFWDINDEHKSKISPYIFGGIGLLNYEQKIPNFTYTQKLDQAGNLIGHNTTETTDYKRATTFALNFGIGAKAKLNYNWIVFAEVGFRPSIVDDLDYSSLYYHAPKMTFKDDILRTEPYYSEILGEYDRTVKNKSTGNPKTNDWLVVTGIGVAYSFGRPPCYCK